jgi:PAS domain S-box-containing protein
VSLPPTPSPAERPGARTEPGLAATAAHTGPAPPPALAEPATATRPPDAQHAAPWLEAVAAPLLQVDAAGRLLAHNSAAAQALGGAPSNLATLAGIFGPAADAWPASGRIDVPARDEGPAPRPALQLHIAALPDGSRLLTLCPNDIAALRRQTDRADRLQALLDLAGEFGRLGVWERDVHTLEGRWDDPMRRLLGLPPGQDTPNFNGAVAAIAEVDRPRADAYYRDSLRQPGRYAQRYRLRGADGVLRRVHSQWRVQAGPDGQPARVLGILMDDSESHTLAAGSSELEAQLALAVDLGGIGIWRHDLLTQRMHYSEQAWAMLGLEPDPAGLDIDQVRALIHPEDLPKVVAAAEAALAADRPVDMDARYRHRDGRWRHIMMRRVVQRALDGTPVAFLGVALDVTDRIEAQRRDEALSRRFELVTHGAGIGYWHVEPGQAGALWSERLRQLVGLRPGQPVPGREQWLRDFIHPDDQARVRRAIAGWRSGGDQVLTLECRVRCTDGQVRWLMTHSRIERSAEQRLAFGVVIDVTETRRAAQALRSANERVALAARGAGLGAWEADLLDGSIFWDEQMWLLRGRSVQPREMSFAERIACVHPDDAGWVREFNARALRTHEPLNFEFRVVWPDGSVHWLASRASTLFGDDGRPLRRIGVNWDVTAVRMAALAQRDSEIARGESQAKSRFLARMSHELRTPLNAVLGFAQLLAADERGSDEAAAQRRCRVAHIRSAGEHLLTLINDVLDLSSLDSGEIRIALAPVSLAAAVRQTLPLLQALQKRHPVQIDAEPLLRSPLAVQADPTRLRQVLLNLLSNAIKYNRPGGRVDVDAHAEGAEVCVRVRDTGHGMTALQLRHLFEPFNRLGRADDAGSPEGSGIGLAIVKTLVERMGGSVQATSEPGVGSVFELRLQATAAPATEPGDTRAAAAPALQDGEPADGSAAGGSPATLAGAAAETPAPGARASVLYIEDNPINAMIIRELIARRTDLRLHEAADGLSGVEQARRLRPDLVLLDMQLPDIDGFEVLARLRADPATAAIPVVALSANAMPDDIERALRAGVADYWTKPLDFRAFGRSLEVLFGPAPS